MRPSLLVLFTALGLAACSSASNRSPFTEDKPAATSSSSSSSSSSSGGAFEAQEGDNDSTGAEDCSEASKLVYVLSDSFDLLSFTPNTGTFAPIGHVDCADTTPNSMAVDRSGTAWVNYASGKLFKVSTKDASCEATTYKAKQGGFSRFGMAFASDAAGGEAETLFVNGIGDQLLGTKGYGLWKIDRTTLALEEIGDFGDTLDGKSAELTGRGDGKLFGFFTTQPNATLAEIDKTTGAASNVQELKGVATGAAWAFSYWGGDFWFYTAALGASASTVTRLATSGDGSLKTVKTNAADIAKTTGKFNIVGAGVSTCAPLSPPK